MKSINTLILLMAGALLSACTAEIKGAGDGIVGAQDTAIEGPALEGTWATRCIESQWGANAGRRKVQVSFTGENFEYQEQSFSDNTCSRLDKKETLRGVYRFKKQNSAGAHQIEYRIPINANAVAIRVQLLQLDGESLKASELDIDEVRVLEAPLKLELLKLTQEGQTPPSSAPTEPAPPVSQTLRSGLYRPQTAGSDYCDQTVSTMSSGGVLQSLSLNFEYPCSGQVALTCQAGVCKNDRYELTLLSDTQFRLKNLRSQETETFQRR